MENKMEVCDKAKSHVDDLLPSIVAHVREPTDFLSILLTCKRWKAIAIKHLDPSIGYNRLFCWACETGNIERVKLLLKDPRVDPSDFHNYSLQYACKNGHLEIVKVLMKDPRVDPGAFHNYALRLAYIYKHSDIIKEMVEDERVNPKDALRYAKAMAPIEDKKTHKRARTSPPHAEAYVPTDDQNIKK
eukprot:TRINITY_DN8069_c0_g1_i2.p1 TRINITY_DN8069_c0_g1~~TRINITY_DN8069_c0_g1_i2.p1  ORF type:complete len:188 (+),score=17.42 TRINITY_DN8069_c0_g1_i2:155-718(+)